MDKLTEGDTFLLRLNVIANRLKFSLESFPLSAVPSEKEVHLRHLLQETLILNLQSLLEIVNPFRGYLRTIGKYDMEEKTRILLQPIIKHQEAIAKLRTNFIAHAGASSNPLLEIRPVELMQKLQFPAQNAEVLFLALCAWHYILLIQENLKVERQSAETKWKTLSQSSLRYEGGTIATFDQMRMEHNKISAEVNKALEDAGFTYVEPVFVL